MGVRYGFPVDGSERGRIRVGDADRDRVAEFLNTAYVDGRLSRDEYDDRLHNALAARTFSDLDQLTTDLPGTQALRVRPPAPTLVAPPPAMNGLAIASLACGLAQFVFGPLPTIPAIVFGHVARKQIRSTGEQGGGMALAGLALGWAMLILALVVVVAVGAFVGVHGSIPRR
jgi:hypothetical protein